ncbi:hypothetical protein BDZ45DRAFT_89878 [Acephala macrosclerotiorum]|nr:hypothetical protein BDZ45DRAFT_89878 [Acephala macrosclerotiorum]
MSVVASLLFVMLSYASVVDVGQWAQEDGDTRERATQSRYQSNSNNISSALGKSILQRTGTWRASKMYVESNMRIT